MSYLTCPCCQLPKREQYCSQCLTEGVATHTSLAKNLRAQADNAIARAENLLSPPNASSPDQPRFRGATAWRELRAQVAASEARVAELRQRLEATTSAIQKAHETINSSDVKVRRESIDSARHSRHGASYLRSQVSLVKSKQQEITQRIIEARRVLVSEAVEVFGVQERLRGGGWEIAGIHLPPPDSFRVHSHITINAALSHTTHLLSLLTRYLSIALPYVPTSPTDLPHVGRQLVKPNLPFLGTTKWRDKYLLWMSSSASIPTRNGTRTITASARQDVIKAVMKASSVKHKNTLTAFALLCFSITYLAWTQGVHGIGIGPSPDHGANRRDSEDEDGALTGTPLRRSSNATPITGAGDQAAGGSPTSATTPADLIPPTAILEILSLITRSPTLGRRSHEPGASSTLRHLGFSLEVAKVVAAVLAEDEERWGRVAGQGEGEELSEGWDLLDE